MLCLFTTDKLVPWSYFVDMSYRMHRRLETTNIFLQYSMFTRWIGTMAIAMPLSIIAYPNQVYGCMYFIRIPTETKWVSRDPIHESGIIPSQHISSINSIQIREIMNAKHNRTNEQQLPNPIHNTSSTNTSHYCTTTTLWHRMITLLPYHRLNPRCVSPSLTISVPTYRFDIIRVGEAAIIKPNSLTL